MAKFVSLGLTQFLFLFFLVIFEPVKHSLLLEVTLEVFLFVDFEYELFIKTSIYVFL